MHGQQVQQQTGNGFQGGMDGVTSANAGVRMEAAPGPRMHAGGGGGDGGFMIGGPGAMTFGAGPAFPRLGQAVVPPVGEGHASGVPFYGGQFGTSIGMPVSVGGQGEGESAALRAQL